MTATARPVARCAAGLRAGVLTACPTDGTLSREVLLLADALTVDAAADPAEHFPWRLKRGKGAAPSTADLPSPILDAPRVCRLREQGGRWWVEYEGGEADALRCVARGGPAVPEPVAARETREGEDRAVVGPLRLGAPITYAEVRAILAGASGGRRSVDPAAILRTPHGQPAVVVDGVAIDNGRTLGYAARTYPLGPRARLRFSGPTPAALSRDLLAAVSLAVWCLRTAAVEAGLARRDDRGKVRCEPGAEAAVARLDRDAGWRSTDLLLELLDTDLAPADLASRVNQAMREEVWAVWRSLEAGLGPVALGRGARALERLLAAKLPVRETADA
jgi:hypothetical protein